MEETFRNFLGTLSLPFLFVLLFGFLYTLSKGADFFVDGAVALSEEFHISKMVIGATIVSIGTTLPELSVSLVASLSGDSQVSLGNAIGSVICNTALIIGIASLIAPLTIQKNQIKKQTFIQLGSAIIIILLSLPLKKSDGNISQIDGLFLLLLLIGYIYLSIRWIKRDRAEAIILPQPLPASPWKGEEQGLEGSPLGRKEQRRGESHLQGKEQKIGESSSKGEEQEPHPASPWKGEEYTPQVLPLGKGEQEGVEEKRIPQSHPDSPSQTKRAEEVESRVAIFTKLVLGIFIVIVSSKLLLPTVQITAVKLGVPNSVIAVTLVAFGTSVPELVTSVVASLKGHGELAIGNVTGANILNILFVIGISSAFSHKGIQVTPDFFGFYFPVMILVIGIFTVGALLSKEKLGRGLGALLLTIYIAITIKSYL